MTEPCVQQRGPLTEPDDHSTAKGHHNCSAQIQLQQFQLIIAIMHTLHQHARLGQCRPDPGRVSQPVFRGVPREATRTTHQFTKFKKIYISSGLKLRRSVAPELVFVLADYLGYHFLVEAGQGTALLQKYPFARPPPG